MTWWSVLIEASTDDDVTESDLERFVDAVEPFSGVVAGVARRYSARLSVTVPTDSPKTAITHALDCFDAASRAAQMPTISEIVRVEALTEQELDRELDEPAFPQLLGVTEVARLLGVTRQRASAIQTSAGFPAPVARLATGPVWTLPSISRFLDEWTRKGGRPAKKRVSA
jgi:hypothetical protein